MTDFTSHPAADLFPVLTGVAFESLVEDIRLHGQAEPIIATADHQIIDGRNRYRACCALGIVPWVETWDGRLDPVSLSLSLNLHRRHLTASQKAALAVDVEAAFAPAAAARQRSGLRHGSAASRATSRLGDSRELAARACFVSSAYVSAAKRLKRDDPERFQAVRRGQLTLAQAARKADRARSGIRVSITDLGSHASRTIYLAGLSIDAVQRLLESIARPTAEAK